MQRRDQLVLIEPLITYRRLRHEALGGQFDSLAIASLRSFETMLLDNETGEMTKVYAGAVVLKRALSGFGKRIASIVQEFQVCTDPDKKEKLFAEAVELRKRAEKIAAALEDMEKQVIRM